MTATAKKLPENPYNPLAWVTGTPEIGEDVWIGAFTLIDGLGGLKIGKGVNVSSGAQILTHSTAKRCLSERAIDTEYAPTTIEDHVFIGTSAVILMGSHIGHHSIIGAGALVLENTIIPPYSLVVGSPARVVRNLQGDVESWKKGKKG